MRHDKDTKSQGGIAETLDCQLISAFNIVLRRERLDVNLGIDAIAFIDDHVQKFAGVDSASVLLKLVVVGFTDASRLEAFAAWLISQGFKMTARSRFEDFAIVHEVHEPTMPCDWLEIIRTSEGTFVDFREDTYDPWLAWIGDVYNWAPTGVATGMRHGFILSRNEARDVWLDFQTGVTVVGMKQ